GGPDYVLRDEINRRRYERGTVGMALSGPDTGGSQYFIAHSPQPHLDGTYTVIGRVDSGYNVIDDITQGDRIRRIRRQ
ncbi:MAG: peptidylprolyl isomerase, partial [Gemmatimonadales bacterium]